LSAWVTYSFPAVAVKNRLGGDFSRK